MALIHPVGNFQDESEKQVVRHMAANLPDDFHLYHNLELIPRRRGHPYEYDLIVVGKASAWAVEVKGYRGVIEGNAKEWMLENGRSERSPVFLTNEKARVLKSNIRRFAPELPDNVYVDSLVVLRFNRTRVHLTDPQADRVVRLFEAAPRILEGDRRLARLGSPTHQQAIICRMLDQWFRPLSHNRFMGEYEVLDNMVDMNPLASIATYPARHRLLKTRDRVSLKVFLLDTSLSEADRNKQREQFLREAEALERLGEHPNVVRCYAPFLCESDKVVVPFQWVDGKSLRARLDEGADWPLPTRLDIFRQVGEGLAHAHRHNVIHRNLCPENIILLPGERAKLVNFKFAKMAWLPSRSITRYLTGLNRRYQAPELGVDIHAATPRSDIFSLGVLLYEIITGYCPASSASALSERGYRRLQLASGTLFPKIYPLFRRMCAVDPAARYNSMDEILTALAEIQHDG